MQLHTTHIDRVTSKGEKGGGRVERRALHRGGSGSRGGYHMRAGRGRKEGSHKGGTGFMGVDHKGEQGGGQGPREGFFIRVLE